MADLLRQAPDLKIHMVEDGYVVRNVATNAVHQLNGTAALLLELCSGDVTSAEVVADMQRMFALSSRQLPGVRQALDALINAGLVVRVPSAGRKPGARPKQPAAKARAAHGRKRR